MFKYYVCFRNKERGNWNCARTSATFLHLDHQKLRASWVPAYVRPSMNHQNPIRVEMRCSVLWRCSAPPWDTPNTTTNSEEWSRITCHTVIRHSSTCCSRRIPLGSLASITIHLERWSWALLIAVHPSHQTFNCPSLTKVSSLILFVTNLRYIQKWYLMLIFDSLYQPFCS